MSHKRIVLFVLLSFFSIILGAVFGLLDIFGFIDGRHAISLTLLIVAIVLMYFVLVILFILNFANNSRMYPMLAAITLLFSTTFFMMSFNLVLTVICGVAYYVFLSYAYSATVRRSKLFVKFVPQDIFFPALKNSFTYLLVILSIIAFVQSQTLVERNSLISPPLIRLFVKPVALTVNQQINSQIRSEIGPILEQIPSDREREATMRQVLRTTIESMADKQTGLVYGIDPKDIPVEDARIYPDGTIDSTPVFEAMLPQISSMLNQKIQEYAIFAPLAIALLTFIILQPLMIPLQLIESFMTIAIFKVLISVGVLRITKETQEVERLHF